VKTYPICLIDLEKQRCVVIGGGKVAARKIAGLVLAGARVEVISPEIDPEIIEFASAGQALLKHRGYLPGDLQSAFLVIAATDDPGINQAVWEEARRCGALINVVDDPQHSNFIVPALVRRGELAIAITTGGSSPALARRMREQLEEQIGPEYGELAAILSELRPMLLAAYPPGEARLQAALRLVDSDMLNILRQQGYQAGVTYGRQILAPHPSDSG
jgi:precorrin-2 dehydrogenase/sirohydrochlorin ferrochelatase